MSYRRTIGAFSLPVVLLVAATVVSQERYSRDSNTQRRSGEREDREREVRQRSRTTSTSDGRDRTATKESISGEVLRTKQVDVRGSANKTLVALVETDDGERKIVDLGTTKTLRDISVRSGDAIRAEGTIKRLGRRNVIFANRVTIDGKSANIQRQRQTSPGKSRLAGYKVSGKAQFSGWIVNTRTARLKNSSGEHLIAQVRDRNGRHVVVDFGPADKARELDLQRNDGVGIAGFKLQVGDQPVVLALRVRTDAGEEMDISRAPSDTNRSAQR